MVRILREAAYEAHYAGKLTREWVGTARNGVRFRRYLNHRS